MMQFNRQQETGRHGKCGLKSNKIHFFYYFGHISLDAISYQEKIELVLYKQY